jgi:hypothetical protein
MSGTFRNAAKDVSYPIVTMICYRKWRAAGRPLPAPSSVKRDIIRGYARGYGLDVLVETGTFYADTVRGLRKEFRQIYSIELDEHLYRLAAARCKRQANAVLLQGDSSVRVPEVLARLTSPALFWLDAHFSGGDTAQGSVDTPVHAELIAILEDHRSHIVLIDDMRLFANGAPDYPSLDFVRQIALDHGYAMSTALDVIRLIPQ